MDTLLDRHMLRFRQISNRWAFECLVSSGAVLLTLIAPRWWLVDAGSDDLLYVRQALSIKSGNWLGSFSDGGGLKLPGFQIFLAFSSYTHIPYYVWTIIIQIIGALLVRNYFKKVARKEYVYRVIFAFCVLNPALFGANNARLLRDGFYSSLLTLLFGLSLHLYIELGKSVNTNRTRTFIYTLSFAFVSTWIAFTREETFLFLFYLIFLILAISLLSNFNKNGLRNAFVLFSLVTSILCVSGFALQQTNKNYYDASSFALIQSGPLISLQNQWARVIPVSSNPRVLVSKVQREKIYRSIPVFGEKEDNLEKYLSWYSGASCGQANVCDDIGSGWTFWGLFYGLTMGEGLSNPIDFNIQVRQMTEEIKNYCASNLDFCDNTIRLPTIGEAKNIIPIIAAVPVEFMRGLLQRGNFDSIQPSSGSLENLAAFQKLLPTGGPPDQWPAKPIGNSDSSLISLLICLFILISFVSRRNNRTDLIFSNNSQSLAPFFFLLILIMFRISATSIISVVGWNVDRSNYELANNTLTWILVGLFVCAPLRPDKKIEIS